MATLARNEPAPPSAAERLAATQAALAETNSKISELDQQRNELLLADDNEGAIKLGIEITNLKLSARAFADKITLLKDLASKEDAARQAKEREALIASVEKRLEQRDKAGAELATAIKQADVAFRKMVDAGQAIIGLWPWQPQDTHAVLLTPNSVAMVIMHEIYKVGARPRSFGVTDKPGVGIDLGGRCPDLRLVNFQEKIKPLTAVCAEASSLASSIMHTGRSTSYVEPTAMDVAVSTNGQGEPMQRSEAQQRLGGLLAKMARLSEDVSAEGEARYLLVVKQVAEMQAQVAAEQKVETQHG